jgi:hypothetical protein
VQKALQGVAARCVADEDPDLVPLCGEAEIHVAKTRSLADTEKPHNHPYISVIAGGSGTSRIRA